MTQIKLDKVSKRYSTEWIFKNVDYLFESGNRYALLGPNGSGKSTLLQAISGYLSPTLGKIHFYNQENEVDSDEAFRLISYSGPYIDLPEELTLREVVAFHGKFKDWSEGMDNEEVIRKTGLASNTHERGLRFFSSGMKQRLKLALAICADTPILLLDEPTITLDEEGVAWYKALLNAHSKDKLVIVATNVAADTDGCCEKLQILDYK